MFWFKTKEEKAKIRARKECIKKENKRRHFVIFDICDHNTALSDLNYGVDDYNKNIHYINYTKGTYSVIESSFREALNDNERTYEEVYKKISIYINDISSEQKKLKNNEVNQWSMFLDKLLSEYILINKEYLYRKFTDKFNLSDKQIYSTLGRYIHNRHKLLKEAKEFKNILILTQIMDDKEYEKMLVNFLNLYGSGKKYFVNNFGSDFEKNYEEYKEIYKLEFLVSKNEELCDLLSTSATLADESFGAEL